MEINEFINELDDLGFNENTIKIRVGQNIYAMLKKELGDFANKFRGVDFVLDNLLEQEEIQLD